MPEVETAAPAAIPASSPAPESAKTTAAPAAESTPAARNERGQFQTPSGPKEPVSKQKDADDIYSRTRARLDKFNEAIAKSDEPEAESAAEESAEPPATETQPDPAPADAEGGDHPAADKPAQEAAADVTPAPTLPAAHVRSLKAFGLTDAEIVKTSPEVAAALHARRNQEITRWAEQGRQQQARTQAAPPVAVQPERPTPAQPAPAAPVADIAALKATYGENEPLIQHVAALQAKAAAQDAELADFRTFRQSWQQQQEQARLASLIRDVDQFFSNKELSAYHAAYGTTTTTLTPEQGAKREEVLKLADAIHRGAKDNGVTLDLHQALQHAFDSVSAPQAKEAARQEIKGELQKRAKGMSLKPGGKPTPKAALPARAELESRARTNLRKVFG